MKTKRISATGIGNRSAVNRYPDMFTRVAYLSKKKNLFFTSLTYIFLNPSVFFQRHYHN